MSRGRKQNALAQRRERDHVDVTATVLEGAGHLEKPVSVTSVPRLSRIWDETLGTGMAFRPEDAPLLEQLVFDLALAEECRANMIDEDGNPTPLLKAEDEYGNVHMVDNPYFKKMREVANDTLKLANDLGLTPVARARLGLTQASANAVNLSIQETILRAMEREGV
jgi:hypothetical protein